MNAQEIARELNEPGAQELLHAAALTRLAYTGRDGFPRVIPIGFYWNGEHVIVCTAPISPKVAALAARPQVALTIDTGVSQAGALLIRGVTAIETVNGVPDEYLRASAKGMDRAQMPDFEATGPVAIQADVADCDHPAVGTLLRLRNPPDPGLPAQTR